MALFIGNAFSLNMVAATDLTKVEFKPLTIDEAKSYVPKAVSVVGHADTAAVFSDVLGQKVDFNRTSLTLKDGDVLVVGQYKGPRLEEGCKTLPEGATIEWVKVELPLPFSWSTVELDEQDLEYRDISYIWDNYGPVSIGWLGDEVNNLLTGDSLLETLTEMMESVPSLSYGDTTYLRVGNELLEVSNHATTGCSGVSTKNLIDMYL